MSNEVYTQAFNFISAVQGGVDPRTGLFMLKFPFGSVHASNHNDFKLALALNYSPICSIDAFQLGTGMNWGFTMYDSRRNLLRLSSGEQYKTYEDGNDIKIRQYTLDVVKIKKSGKIYLVNHKSGTIELLTECGDKLYYTTRIESSLGTGFNLQWSSEARPCLKNITTDTGLTVCSVTYQRSVKEVIISLWPEQGENITSIFRLEMTGALGQSYLTKITNESITPHLTWKLDYNHNKSVSLNGAGPLYQITTPTGLVETASYTPTMTLNTFHGNGKLPAVTIYRIIPGNDQPNQVVHYHYSARNYLGADATFTSPHADDDNLYNVLNGYTYSTTETHPQAGGNQEHIITRTYNNYHLLIDQTEQQGHCIYQIKTEFFTKAGVKFKDQPVTFQMSKKHTSTWKNNITGLSRSEITSYEYDEFGNIIKQITPDGTVNESTYYQSAGQVGCPAEPAGFTRFIKSHTVTPVKSIYCDEPSLRTVYSYKKINALSNSHAKYSVVQDNVINYCYTEENEKEKPRSRTEFTYFEESLDVQYGCQKSKLYTFYDIQGDAYSDHLQNYYSLKGNELITTTIFTTNADPLTHSAAKLTLKTSKTYCNLTGRVLIEVDVAGNKIKYVYDSLGRLLRKIYHPEHPEYLSEEMLRYTLPLAGSKMPVYMVHTDNYGNQTRTAFDGQGRIIGRSIIDQDAGSALMPWKEIQTLSYDEWGRCHQTINRDFLHSDNNAIKDTILQDVTTRTWDDWGMLETVIHNTSGVISHSVP